MTGRPTGEIVADLREKLQAGNSELGWEAADRLTELDARAAAVVAAWDEGELNDLATAAAIDELRELMAEQ